MKLITFLHHGLPTPGLTHDGKIISLQEVASREGFFFPHTMEDFIRNIAEFETLARRIDDRFKKGDYIEFALEWDDKLLFAPVQRPSSCRDGYAFRQHVETARRNRGVPMIPEFDQYPVFYFTNHNAILGPGEVPCMLDHFQKLDFELEAAIVIGRRGRNIAAKDADAYIFGYTIMNDFSARVLQMEEMLLNLGPAKGKDFATTIGPMLVTPDELQAYKTNPPNGHIGAQFDLKMVCRVNGIQVSEGNMAQMDWTFAELIERASYGVDLYPTDVIGSGTVGTGCFLELNGTGLLHDPNYKTQWLQEGDVVELEIDGLGVLKNTIVKEGNESLLAKKHTIR